MQKMTAALAMLAGGAGLTILTQLGHVLLHVLGIGHGF